MASTLKWLKWHELFVEASEGAQQPGLHYCGCNLLTKSFCKYYCCFCKRWLHNSMQTSLTQWVAEHLTNIKHDVGIYPCNGELWIINTLWEIRIDIFDHIAGELDFHLNFSLSSVVFWNLQNTSRQSAIFIVLIVSFVFQVLSDRFWAAFETKRDSCYPTTSAP